MLPRMTHATKVEDDDSTMDGSVEIVLKYSVGYSTLGSLSMDAEKQETMAPATTTTTTTMYKEQCPLLPIRAHPQHCFAPDWDSAKCSGGPQE